MVKKANSSGADPVCECESLMELGRYGEAIQCYDKILAADPDNMDVQDSKGNSLLELCRYKDAIQCYDIVLAADPGNTDIQYNKGTAMFYLGRYKDAIQCYDKVLGSIPDDAYALFYKGRSLDGLCRHDEAGEYIDKARELDDTLAFQNDKIEYKLGADFETLYGEEEILNARNALFNNLKPHAAKTGHASLGYRGGSESHMLAYNEAADIWWNTNDVDRHGCDPIHNRYWNCFGSGEPRWTGSNNITVELNFPKYGVNRQISGAIVRDRQNNLHLAHSGRITSAASSKITNWTNYAPILVDDGRKQPRPMMLITPVTGPDVLGNITKFVRDVERLKVDR